MSNKTIEKNRKEEIKRELKNVLEKSNKTIYVSIKQTSKDNMIYYFHAYTIIKNELIPLDYYLRELGMYESRFLVNWGYVLKSYGVGSDRAFEVASTISEYIYNDTYKLHYRHI